MRDTVLGNMNFKKLFKIFNLFLDSILALTSCGNICVTRTDNEKFEMNEVHQCERSEHLQG